MNFYRLIFCMIFLFSSHQSKRIVRSIWESKNRGKDRTHHQAKSRICYKQRTPRPYARETYVAKGRKMTRNLNCYRCWPFIEISKVKNLGFCDLNGFERDFLSTFKFVNFRSYRNLRSIHHCLFLEAYVAFSTGYSCYHSQRSSFTSSICGDKRFLIHCSSC